MRKLLIGVGAAVGVVVGLGFAAPLLVDLNAQKPRIAALIEEATGHRVSLGGDIRFTLLPVPAVSVRDIVVEGETPDAPNLATVAAIDLRLSLLPLLGGVVDVAEIRLSKPTVTWAEPTATPAVAPASAGNAEAGPGGSAPGIAVQRVVIEDGSFEYRPRGGDIQRIETIEASLSAPSLQGPFTASGGASYRGMPVLLDLVLGRLTPGTPIGFDARLGLAGAGVHASGNLQLGAAGPAIDGKAVLTVEDAAAVTGLTGISLPLAGAVSIEGQLKATPAAIALDDLVVAVGEARGSGRLAIQLGDTPSVSLKMRLPRLDGDALHAAFAGDASKTKPDVPAAATLPAAETAAVDLPRGLTADVDLAIDAVQYAGAVVQKIAVVATLEGGRLTLSNASAVLPGGTDFGLSGSAASRDGRLRFEGSVDVASDNPRALTDWLKITPEGLPADRLTRFGLTGKLVTDGVGGTLGNLVVRLDGATARGSAGWQPGPRPVAMLSLDIDRLDLDGYRNAAPALPASAPATGNPLAQIGAPTASPLAGLGFDIALRLAAKSVTFDGRDVKAVLLDGTLSAEALRLAEFTVGDFAGLALGAKGKLGFVKDATEGDFEVRATAPSPAPLFALAGEAAPADVDSLGALVLEAHITGKPDSPVVDAKLGLGDTRLALAGSIGRLDALNFDLKGALSAPELIAVARQIGLTPAPAGPVLGPVDLTVALRGVPKSPAFELKGMLGPAEVQASAAVETEGGYKFTGRLNGANGAGMLTRLGLTGPVSGPLKLDVDAVGGTDQVKLNGLKLVLGDSDLSIRGKIAFGATTRFDGQATATRLDLALFGGGAPAANPSGAPAKSTGGQAGRWSTKPLDLAAFRRIEGTLDLAVDRIVSGRFVLTGVAARVDAASGRIAVSGLKAFAEPGTLEGGLVLDASGDAVALSVDLKANGFDLDRVTGRQGGEPGLSGSGALVVELAGRGRSTFEIVSSLAGKGALVASNGKLQGIDLKALSDGLATVNQPGDIVGRIAHALKSGATDYRRISTGLVIDKGVIRLDGLASDMDGASLGGEGTIDLPAWATKVRLALQLVAPADLPALGIDLTGPPDDVNATVRSRDIENYYLQKFIGSKLPGLPGGGSGGGSGKAIVDQLLKGLGGN
ncbi:AsmA family protein [Zavarzinia aquatilis]|uniref:AsmA family protein n=1 Tax=Zavarzinia aquatilis TaxID=2211142 RepID=UPI001401BC47|nr:AsmA family protein [Zavarzinia aquatilis]